MKKISLDAPAKINLFLHITDKRDDGYHNIQTIFQLLDYSDNLTFCSRNDNKIQLSINPESFFSVKKDDNLILNAAELLQKISIMRGKSSGVDINLSKKIPIGGGLGGGSSNAATTILGLNYLWNLNLSNEELFSLGRKLGADVPLFIKGENCFAEGIGDKITPLKLPKMYFVVLKPPINVSTKDVFSQTELTRNTQRIKMAAILDLDLKNILFGSIKKPKFVNDCESVVRSLYEPVNDAFNWLNQYAKARMTGTGSCVFACFENYDNAKDVLARMPKYYTGFIALGSELSKTHIQLNKIKSE
jgi:4-diphosphocytidyl-2-C-methyl-D-erythritol kinase